MATCKISVLYLIKCRTFWYTERLNPTSSYTWVIHFKKCTVFIAPSCISSAFCCLAGLMVPLDRHISSANLFSFSQVPSPPITTDYLSLKVIRQTEQVRKCRPSAINDMLPPRWQLTVDRWTEEVKSRVRSFPVIRRYRWLQQMIGSRWFPFRV